MCKTPDKINLPDNYNLSLFENDIEYLHLNHLLKRILSTIQFRNARYKSLDVLCTSIPTLVT